MSRSDNKIVGVFLNYRDVLVRTLVRWSVQPADVDDILQESLARTLEADEKSPVEFPKSYLYAVTRNIVFEQHERRSREVQWEIDQAILESETSPADEEIHYRRMMAVFLEAMRTLPKAHQRAILLRRIYGLSQKEIAAKMGVSLSSVEKYFAQGIRRCQEIMAIRGYETAIGKRMVSGMVRQDAAPHAEGGAGKGRDHD